MKPGYPGKPVKDPLQSPCVRNCCLNDNDVCMGCGRTLSEIRLWAGLSEKQRAEVLSRAAARFKDGTVRTPYLPG